MSCVKKNHREHRPVNIISKNRVNSNNSIITNCKYDLDTSQLDAQNSTYSLQHQIYPVPCNICLPDGSNSRNIGNPYYNNMDADNILRGLNNSSCRNYQTHVNDLNLNNNIAHCQFKQEYTHMKGDNLIERETDRFLGPILNPQDERRWFVKDRIGVNSMDIAKECYKPRMPVIMDQTECIPSCGRQLPCRPIAPLCLRNY